MHKSNMTREFKYVINKIPTSEEKYDQNADMGDRAIVASKRRRRTRRAVVEGGASTGNRTIADLRSQSTYSYPISILFRLAVEG